MAPHSTKPPAEPAKKGRPDPAAKLQAKVVDLEAAVAKILEKQDATTSLMKAIGERFRVSGKDPKAAKMRDAVRRHRSTKRQKGMKLVQLWVPDTEAPGFAEEARRQSAIIAAAADDPTSDEAQMNRELDAWAGESSANEPDYDWGPKGPPK